MKIGLKTEDFKTFHDSKTSVKQNYGHHFRKIYY